MVLAAADAFVEKCEREPAQTRRVNVEAAFAVRDAAEEADATLVVSPASTSFQKGRAIQRGRPREAAQ
jgi:dTDP-4-dehydrorhamnose reductase